MLLLISLLSHICWSLACWGGAQESEEEKKPGMLDPMNKKHWNGWNPPPGAAEAWQDWLQHYKKEMAGKGGYKDPNSPGKPYGHDIPGWPSDWAGLGPPFTGIAPPPWAYVPRNLGKPSYCYLAPKIGNCTQYTVRYGYNPFMDQCQSFFYGGCFGNQNNFVWKKSCEKSCMSVPTSGCNPDSGIPMRDF